MRALVLTSLIGLLIAGLVLTNWPQPQHRGAVIDQMKSWNTVPQANWKRTQASTISDLIDPMIGGFPSRMEGNPSIAINIRRLEEDRMMLAHLQMRGFLDDSVNGEELTALIEPSQSGWKLTALWRRHECARGFNIRRWTTKRCS